MDKIKIEHQGAPIVNTDSVHTVSKSKDVILLEIDMASKYCEVIGTMYMTGGYPSIIIGAGPDGIHLKEDEDGATYLDLCGYKEWEIFLSSISRYTLRVCLTRRGIR